MPADQVVCRFAPSPSGRMHAGNVYAALVSWLYARACGGKVVLRIEDLDVQRSKPEYIDQICRDFERLGLSWDEGPFYQSSSQERYEEAFSRLETAGLVYPCFCTRADLHAASAPHFGERVVYPGTCRKLDEAERARKLAVRPAAYRVMVAREILSFKDMIFGHVSQDLERECGDFMVRRSDGLFAYQLAVVVDDAAQGVNCVVRGCDLLTSVPQQAYLQKLLGYAPCRYAHVPLLVNAAGKRLSKRDRSAGLDEMMASSGSPEAVIGHIAYLTGLIGEDAPASAADLLSVFEPASYFESLDRRISFTWA